MTGKPKKLFYADDGRDIRTSRYQQLVTLAAALEHGGFERAANALRVDKDTVSADLTKLSDWLGVELFTEDTNHPTDHARELVPLADMLTHVFGAMRARASKTVRIAMTSHLSRNYLPCLLNRKDIKKQISSDKLRIAVLDRRADHIPEAVLRGEADIGVGPVQGPKSTGLEVWKVSSFHSKLVVLSLPEQAPAHGRFDWEELVSKKLILHERGTGTRLALERAWQGSVSESKRRKPRPPLSGAIEVSDAMLMLELVAAGHGLGITAMGPAIREFAQPKHLPSPRLAINEAPISDTEEIRVSIMVRGSVASDAVDLVASGIYEELAKELGAPDSFP